MGVAYKDRARPPPPGGGGAEWQPGLLHLTHPPTHIRISHSLPVAWQNDDS